MISVINLLSSMVMSAYVQASPFTIKEPEWLKVLGFKAGENVVPNKDGGVVGPGKRSDDSFFVFMLPDYSTQK